MNPTYSVTFCEKDSPGYGPKSSTWEVPVEMYTALQAVLSGRARVVPAEAPSADDPQGD